MIKIVYFFLIFLFFFNIKLYAQDGYFLTLRNSKVNLRQGPSFEHPIKLVYKKKFLPVLVIDKLENFRKIKDHENNSGWVHISQLSKKKAALNIKNETVMFNKASEYSKPLALIEKGRLCLIKKCKNDWCKIKSGKYSGWIKKDGIWGRL